MQLHQQANTDLMSEKARNILGGTLAIILLSALLFNYWRGIPSESSEEESTSMSLSRAGLEAVIASNSDPARLGTAIQLLEEATRIDPKDPVALFGLGWALHLKGNKPEALERYNSGIDELNELTKFSLLNRSLIREEQGDFKGALDDLSAALRIAPGLPGAEERQIALRKLIVETR